MKSPLRLKIIWLKKVMEGRLGKVDGYLSLAQRLYGGKASSCQTSSLRRSFASTSSDRVETF